MERRAQDKERKPMQSRQGNEFKLMHLISSEP